MKHDTYDIQDLIETSYEQGFSDGYDAALVPVKAILMTMKLPDSIVNEFLDGMIKAKQGAYPFMGCPPTAKKISLSLNNRTFH